MRDTALLPSRQVNTHGCSDPSRQYKELLSKHCQPELETVPDKASEGRPSIILF